jgi:hypothetical protein
MARHFARVAFVRAAVVFGGHGFDELQVRLHEGDRMVHCPGMIQVHGAWGMRHGAWLVRRLGGV